MSILTCIPKQAINTRSRTTKVDNIPKQIEQIIENRTNKIS